MDENDICTVISILVGIFACEIFQTIMMMIAN